MSEPCYMRQVAYMSDLPLATIRSNCHRLAKVNGMITLIDNEALKWGGPDFSIQNLADRRFYTPEVEQRLTRFAGQTFARARRLTGTA